ncbi:hypothetical protein [Gordonia sp. (in: high G+C Gram-positive bacteria)]|jgi:hypothetical protein|uniref:hypothetical protein n=1 Tax=Gordonia sp. (in: high G+C Gram-positive bacteria) TaxID=84139 RepID=UPI001DBD055F|nr:hypothetical protein [Gordonia sp. (in: high G+C Gram-positive bacteria)]MCB1293662.1 hypothetical protein [Gordonia sp. (in: high G+C Gram-positive bacteria)]HMS74370.1 hypothetical protein [Gordonia sp. (in: high G+C Gram-positive bacteria)]
MPAYPVELLADLHAGIVDEATAAHIRTHLDDDARAVLAALDRTVADLAAWPVAPEEVPDEVLARSRTTLAGLSARREPASAPNNADPPDHKVPNNVVDIARRPRRGKLIIAAASIAAVAAGGITVAALTAGSEPATDPPQGTLIALSPAERAALLTALGSRTPAFPDDAGRRGCTRAHGIADDVPIAGSAPVRLRGRDVVVILVTTGMTGRFTALVVGPECGPGNPATIAETTIGG